ncbi:type II toxin-antitoxin system PemK/MazF family toxin [Streptomyces sp. M2CJ-2]|uniref:type II toxin-antitoxin system PemK/MazF family toxin n=1 Tax=Streptomyces sp. M2CJ-2 TaxID=2803948 RepID=UPI0019274DAB|nr:type II toxin-antitoxin system PemK/MazF family toxin [Streptomyces sp. M2CJ-2]MBL3666767.1 type II toxin-antitoxin system PemK/MazF family toxin [Streptomyces sp. M2CJ-2]
MDTSWWLALVAVVLLALVATLVDGWGRGRRPRSGRRAGARRTRSATADADTGGGPRPAEIWWADAPYEDGPAAGSGASKDRPCLVLAVRGERATVAKITTRFREGRGRVIPLPVGAVGDARGRASFLETDEVREVPVRGFRRRVGVVDRALWERVRHLAR